MTSYPDPFNETVIKTYEEEFPLLMPRWGYVASAFILFLIGFFGFFLNLMVILLMFKDRQLWTPLNIILFNLVCADFSVSILGNPFTLMSALFHRWVFGHTMCVLYGFFMALLGITSITTLTVISFERYLMVSHPLSSRHLSHKGAVLAILFIWSYSLALTVPPLIGWGNYVNEAANISCSVNWHERSRNTLTYIIFLFAMGQILPLSIITFSYVNIIRTLRETSQRLGRVNRAEARATAMVFTMIIAFTVAWTPYSLFALMEQFATEGIVSPGVGVIPALVAKSSICYDPLIYVGMNTQFRTSIKTIFGAHAKSKDSQGDKLNNTQVTPGHKQSSSRLPSSDTGRQFQKKQMLDDPGTTNYNQRMVTAKSELVTLQEINLSDAERSSDMLLDDESSSRKMYMFGESCRAIKDGSPILTYIDSERLLFSKPRISIEENVFGNVAYETHPTDNMTTGFDFENECSIRKSKIGRSRSYNFDRYPSENKAKLSVETKLEVQSKGFLRDTLGRLFEHETSVSDSVKSYLYDGKTKMDGEDS